MHRGVALLESVHGGDGDDVAGQGVKLRRCGPVVRPALAELHSVNSCPREHEDVVGHAWGSHEVLPAVVELQLRFVTLVDPGEADGSALHGVEFAGQAVHVAVLPRSLRPRDRRDVAAAVFRLQAEAELAVGHAVGRDLLHACLARRLRIEWRSSVVHGFLMRCSVGRETIS